MKQKSKKMQLRFLVLSIALLPMTALSAGPVYISGWGNDSCGQYLDKTAGAQGEEYRNLYVAWAAGFISGSNWQYPDGDHQSRTQDNASIVAFIDNFCRRNPLKNVIAATAALVAETGGRDVKFKYER